MQDRCFDPCEPLNPLAISAATHEKTDKQSGSIEMCRHDVQSRHCLVVSTILAFHGFEANHKIDMIRYPNIICFAIGIEPPAFCLFGKNFKTLHSEICFWSPLAESNSARRIFGDILVQLPTPQGYESAAASAPVDCDIAGKGRMLAPNITKLDVRRGDSSILICHIYSRFGIW